MEFDKERMGDTVESGTLYFGEYVIAPLRKIGNNFSSNSMPFPEIKLNKVY